MQRNNEFDVPEVLNVHVNENKKKSTFSRRIFFQAIFASKKLTFEKENVILFNTFFNSKFISFNCSYFFVNFSHTNVQNFRYI